MEPPLVAAGPTSGGSYAAAGRSVTGSRADAAARSTGASAASTSSCSGASCAGDSGDGRPADDAPCSGDRGGAETDDVAAAARGFDVVRTSGHGSVPVLLAAQHIVDALVSRFGRQLPPEQIRTPLQRMVDVVRAGLDPAKVVYVCGGTAGGAERDSGGVGGPTADQGAAAGSPLEGDAAAESYLGGAVQGSGVQRTARTVRAVRQALCSSLDDALLKMSQEVRRPCESPAIPHTGGAQASSGVAIPLTVQLRVLCSPYACRTRDCAANAGHAACHCAVREPRLMRSIGSTTRCCAGASM